LCEEVETLARKIAGTEANVEIRELARRAAEAQIDLDRGRYARYRLLSDALSNPDYESRADTRQMFALILSREAKQLLAMDRYERRALLRRKVALRALDDLRRPTPYDCS
jgi:hypothetical protein